MHFVRWLEWRKPNKSACLVSLAPVNPFWPSSKPLDARGDDFYDSFDKDEHRKKKGRKKGRKMDKKKCACTLGSISCVDIVEEEGKDDKVCRVIKQTYSGNLFYVNTSTIPVDFLANRPSDE